MDLAPSVLSGDRLALARLVTQVENDTTEGREALDTLFPLAGKAHLIGITGAPGTGKSSLVNRMAQQFRQQGQRVAIVAIDPSSPFTGGAVLGDRVRMRELSGDTDVFIRSMASRGSLGGLARATADIVQVFDAAGYDLVLIETVGAGQGEVDIARLAHTTIVVEAPGLGDDIQAIKAGILEIADILVVNKADRPGVENTEKALKAMLELSHPVQKIHLRHGPSTSEFAPLTIVGQTTPSNEIWIPPVLRTISTEGKGISLLTDQIALHANYLHRNGLWVRREHARLASQMDSLLEQSLMSRFRAQVSMKDYDEIMNAVFNRSLSPGAAVNLLLDSKPTIPDTRNKTS